MSYFEAWNQKMNDTEDQAKYSAYVQHYYDLEKNAYGKILSAYPEIQAVTAGSAAALAGVLGFPGEDMEIFVGFIEGINQSLIHKMDPESMEDDTQVSLEIDFEKLYWNMREAKADWLYNLPAWDNVLTKEKRAEITKTFRESKIVHTEKIGRNDPCPCGSGKKYKHCCMNRTESFTA